MTHTSILAQRTREDFSRALREAIRKKFNGRAPSNVKFAEIFSIQCELRDVVGVTHESVRRWLTGMHLPSLTHLSVLIEWLGVDFQKILHVHYERLEVEARKTTGEGA